MAVSKRPSSQLSLCSCDDCLQQTAITAQSLLCPSRSVLVAAVVSSRISLVASLLVHMHITGAVKQIPTAIIICFHLFIYYRFRKNQR